MHDIRLSTRRKTSAAEADTDDNTTVPPSTTSANSAPASATQRLEIVFPNLPSAFYNGQHVQNQAPTPSNTGYQPLGPRRALRMKLQDLLEEIDAELADRSEDVTTLSPGDVGPQFSAFMPAFRKLKIRTLEDLLLIREDYVSNGRSPAEAFVDKLGQECDFEDVPSHAEMARILRAAAAKS
jgi:hypothetical protein